MSTDPEIVMAFPNLDAAESALDWIGLDFGEGAAGGEGWFEGELDEDASGLLDAAFADDETPQAVRALAAVLRERARDAAPPRSWRVTFPTG
jgi:hypothetical protein